MNRGAQLLQRALAERGAQAALARAFSVHDAVVTKWIKGDRTPDIKNRKRLEDLHGIPWRSWDEPPEEGDGSHQGAA